MNTVQTLQALQNDVDEILEIVDSQFEKLSIEQLIWKSAPEKWSVAECLLHLNLANGYYVKKIGIQLDDSSIKTMIGKGRFSLSFNGKIFVNYIIDPQTKYKFKAPKQVRPDRDIDTVKIKKKFVELLKIVKRQMSDASNLDLDKIKISSPFTRFLKFRLGDVFIITVRHTRRHINQALRVIQAEGFPG